MKFSKVLLLSILVTLLACKTNNSNYQVETKNADYIHRSVKQLTDIIVHDIFSPPVASRNYVYPCIAGYEVLVQDYPEYKSLQGQLRDLKDVPQKEAGLEYCLPLAATQAFISTGRFFIFSEDKMNAYETEIMAEFAALNIPKDVFDRSVEYGNAVSKHILDWAGKDMYKQTRTFPKYSIPNDLTMWTPTPPDYMDAIEPHWNKIRPMVLDSASQFAPPPPTPFSMEKDSKFYQEVMEVYGVVKNLTEEQLSIAKFWDCNPFVSHHTGHVVFATKKITPGGHWMNIAATASKKSNADMMKTMQTYTLTAIALFDGFISCWDEKYRSKLLRPETVINRQVDEEWKPTLQTPPFPEHTSGHSVISGAASTALTSIYGDNFAYVDSTEVEYGLPARSFISFKAAAEEAAISRMYGGIHYRPAIDYGVTQGRAVGALLLDRVKFK
jgi:PAP2 superfamily